MRGSGVRATCGQRVTEGIITTSVCEYGLEVRYIWQILQGGTCGELNKLGDSRWSGMFKRRTQVVELYMLGEGGLGWSEQVMSRAFPGNLG